MTEDPEVYAEAINVITRLGWGKGGGALPSGGGACLLNAIRIAETGGKDEIWTNVDEPYLTRLVSVIGCDVETGLYGGEGHYVDDSRDRRCTIAHWNDRQAGSQDRVLEVLVKAYGWALIERDGRLDDLPAWPVQEEARCLVDA